MEDLKKYILEIALFFESKGMNISPLPNVIFSKDSSYVNDVFGKTAWYDPSNKKITLITEGRHKKDILRSFAHEMVHHVQNLRGEFDKSSNEALNDPMYAHNDKHLRNMELEAYAKGNMLFREWEDKKKNNK